MLLAHPALGLAVLDGHRETISVALGFRVFMVGAIGTVVSLIVGSKRAERKGPPVGSAQGRGYWLAMRHSRFLWAALAIAGLVIMVIVH